MDSQISNIGCPWVDKDVSKTRGWEKCISTVSAQLYFLYKIFERNIAKYEELLIIGSEKYRCYNS